jgi:hypothetical protein
VKIIADILRILEKKSILRNENPETVLSRRWKETGMTGGVFL